ncbi:hypothetical protein ABB37_06334 [Leptomonas pyrrhocoris]|uniref:NTF2 domain-containing protein n=1 Tax=Leptomonas pyrrhocoris TaxID=157538 RepID=A0A0N0DTZ5_LEPPY|nr:hypothetical protein ABB37_06334 [Leptomonas pyrrhocoris]KPA78161.1 hypothetical protein ABB37_06334 [Leptomonas pyrrhocoris]|eukprot:XP_015656600.1 hypothetical protein ABB37_06334 [Leptomonas pyrrhocoris]
MSDQSLAPEMAFTVASTFLSYYYSEFVKLNELARMSDLYDERSYMTLVDFRDEVPVVAHGRNAVANLLAKLDGSLGQRKVEIITVDTVALPHNCVQVICQGVMYLREYRRVFLHVFVLEPTAYRTKTYHISSDYLRFVDSEKEVIPEGSVVIAADQVANYLEESRRRVEEEQRRQLIEFQQRIRAQQEAAQARAKAEAEAARAKAQREQHQQQQAAAAAVRIPQPASRQGRAEGPHPHRNEAAEGGNDRRERRERPPRDGGNNDRHERPAGAAGTRHNEEGRPERKPREQRGDGRAEREPRGEGHAERKPRGDGRPEREPRGEGHAERKPRGEGRAEREPRGEGRGDRKPRGEGHAERKPVEGSDRRKKPAAAGAAGDAAPAAPAPERKPRATGPTAACILLRVPKKIKLSDIKAELASQGGAVPDDMFWCGPSSAHAVLKFDSVDKATALYSKKVFTIQEESIPVNYYHE